MGGPEGELGGGLGGEREAIEAVFEDRVDVPIGARLDGAGARASGFEPGAAVALGEAQDAQAGAIALLGVRAIGEDGADEGGGLGPRVRAQSIRREGDHSRWARWALGMWAGSVVCRPRRSWRTWAATRWPRWKISTVVAVRRASTSSCRRG